MESVAVDPGKNGEAVHINFRERLLESLDQRSSGSVGALADSGGGLPRLTSAAARGDRGQLLGRPRKRRRRGSEHAGGRHGEQGADDLISSRVVVGRGGVWDEHVNDVGGGGGAPITDRRREPEGPDRDSPAPPPRRSSPGKRVARPPPWRSTSRTSRPSGPRRAEALELLGRHQGSSLETDEALVGEAGAASGAGGEGGDTTTAGVGAATAGGETTNRRWVGGP